MSESLPPEEVRDEEDLGRGIFSSRHAKRSQRSGVPFNIFLERQGVGEISVDRLSHAPESEAVLIAEKVGRSRSQRFFGWAIVSAIQARLNDRKVVSSPLPDFDNPYHADILLPRDAVEDRDEQTRHAKLLADASRWKEKPHDD